MREPVGWVALAFAVALAGGWLIGLVYWLAVPGAHPSLGHALAALFGLMVGVVWAYSNRWRGR